MKLSLNLGLGFEMVQDSIKMILRWSKMALRWSKRVPREPQDEASWAKMIQDCSIYQTRADNEYETNVDQGKMRIVAV